MEQYSRWLFIVPLLLSPSVAFAIGCGGFLKPVFPANAPQDYENTCWIARVETDEFTDLTSCRIYPAGSGRYGAYPFALFTRNNELLGVAGGQKFPGSTTMIRVDDNEAVSGDDAGFSGSSSALLITQMSSGKVIRARFSEWPSKLLKTGVMDAAGFDEAVEFCRSSVQ